MINITITHRNDNPESIWNKLAARLGREPTDKEAADEVRSILDEAAVERAMAEKMPHQRRGNL